MPKWGVVGCVDSRPAPSHFTNPVCQPAVKERLIGWAALGEPEVALALKRLERAHQHRFPARFREPEECVERAERACPDPSVRQQVGIVRGRYGSAR